MDRLIFDLTKLLIYVLNFLTFVLGVTILTLSVKSGAETRQFRQETSALRENSTMRNFDKFLFFCSTNSISTILLSFVGVVSVFRESKFGLTVDCFLWSLIYSFSLLLGCLICFDEKQIVRPASVLFESHYESTLSKLNSVRNSTFAEKLDQLHRNLKCCALTSLNDFNRRNLSIPISCRDDRAEIFHNFCLDRFRSEIFRKTRIFGLCFFVASLVIFVSLLFKILVLRKISRDRMVERVVQRLRNFSLDQKRTTIDENQKQKIDQILLDFLLDSID